MDGASSGGMAGVGGGFEIGSAYIAVGIQFTGEEALNQIKQRVQESTAPIQAGAGIAPAQSGPAGSGGGGTGGAFIPSVASPLAPQAFSSQATPMGTGTTAGTTATPALTDIAMAQQPSGQVDVTGQLVAIQQQLGAQGNVVGDVISVPSAAGVSHYTVSGAKTEGARLQNLLATLAQGTGAFNNVFSFQGTPQVPNGFQVGNMTTTGPGYVPSWMGLPPLASTGPYPQFPGGSPPGQARRQNPNAPQEFETFVEGLGLGGESMIPTNAYDEGRMQAEMGGFQNGFMGPNFLPPPTRGARRRGFGGGFGMFGGIAQLTGLPYAGVVGGYIGLISVGEAMTGIAESIYLRDNPQLIYSQFAGVGRGLFDPMVQPLVNRTLDIQQGQAILGAAQNIPFLGPLIGALGGQYQMFQWQQEQGRMGIEANLIQETHEMPFQVEAMRAARLENPVLAAQNRFAQQRDVLNKELIWHQADIAKTPASFAQRMGSSYMYYTPNPEYSRKVSEVQNFQNEIANLKVEQDADIARAKELYHASFLALQVGTISAQGAVGVAEAEIRGVTQSLLGNPVGTIEQQISAENQEWSTRQMTRDMRREHAVDVASQDKKVDAGKFFDAQEEAAESQHRLNLSNLNAQQIRTQRQLDTMPYATAAGIAGMYGQSGLAQYINLTRQMSQVGVFTQVSQHLEALRTEGVLNQFAGGYTTAATLNFQNLQQPALASFTGFDTQTALGYHAFASASQIAAQQGNTGALNQISGLQEVYGTTREAERFNMGLNVERGAFLQSHQARAQIAANEATRQYMPDVSRARGEIASAQERVMVEGAGDENIHRLQAEYAKIPETDIVKRRAVSQQIQALQDVQASAKSELSTSAWEITHPPGGHVAINMMGAMARGTEAAYGMDLSGRGRSIRHAALELNQAAGTIGNQALPGHERAIAQNDELMKALAKVGSDLIPAIKNLSDIIKNASQGGGF